MPLSLIWVLLALDLYIWNLPYSEALPNSAVYGCPNANRGIVLTIDDGPSNTTNAMLDTLKALKVKATFFVVGVNVVNHEAEVKRMVAEGHEVGSHTWSHQNLTRLVENKDFEALRTQVDEYHEYLHRLTGKPIRYLRPPYGTCSVGVNRYLRERDIVPIQWNSGCIDWYNHNMTIELPFLVNGMADSGAIICLHDQQSTVDGMPDLVEAFTGTNTTRYINPQGRKIITLDECLHVCDEEEPFLHGQV
ncbi:hypothetical protein SmJEL517_g06110 [Synchytrium microbalum]|uniref:NodB homology domain-containing protein n=1 Tax=Synchytrium microbalum TaxID=1806994 RepID=A0A507BYF3_9FUNG|nr:uncharacterized protein SmJEL517_g06110 [Synchytrium microbalum]TPX30303.1 hypothetical protein SmJEL517_g06110 [Synchytrium microbalum]